MALWQWEITTPALDDASEVHQGLKRALIDNRYHIQKSIRAR
jgi:hypothetical protein